MAGFAMRRVGGARRSKPPPGHVGRAAPWARPGDSAGRDRRRVHDGLRPGSRGKRGGAYLASALSALTSVQQHFSTLFFARGQYSLPSRFSQQHLSTTFPVREQRSFPAFSAIAVADFFAQQGGVMASSPANTGMLRNPVQHRASTVRLVIPISSPLQRVSLKITSVSSS